MRKWLVWVAVALTACIGAAAAVYGGLEVKKELERPPTKAEKDAAAIQEVALRWRTLKPTDLFPAKVDYTAGPVTWVATRAGIVKEAPCAKALDAAVVKAVPSCQTVLRATYLDQTQSAVTTVGVAVLPDSASVDKAAVAIRGMSTAKGVRAAPIPGTVAARYRDQARQLFVSMEYGNYLVFVATGYTDGRKKITRDRTGIFTFGHKIATEVGLKLKVPKDPCTVREAVTC